MARLRELISAVFLSATLSLTAVKAEAQKAPQLRDKPFIPETYQPFQSIRRIDDPPQLILKKPAASGEDLQWAGHRSHRSHSSHRSHYSHYSSRSGGYSSDSPDRSPSKSLTPSYIPQKGAYTLGSRTLMKGMTGPDVLEMKKLMQAQGYKVDLNDKFDELTEVILRDFQAKNGIPQDGRAGPLTIYYLKNK